MAAPINTAAVTIINRNQWVVESRSNPGTLHVVKRVRGGLSCTCDGALHGMRCWHVSSVEQIDRPAETFKVDPALGLSVLMAPARQTA